jgi:DNA-binding MarR family transcriptional regulator
MLTESKRRRLEEVATARAFYAALGQEVGYFAALWHTFNVGRMLSTDLDRICRKHGLSLADFTLMGALRIDRAVPMRATDLAVTLQVANSALTERVSKLIAAGIVLKTPAPDDRRAFTLQLTPQAAALVEAIHSALAQDSLFVRAVNRLSEADRAALERIMAELHGGLDRHFVDGLR